MKKPISLILTAFVGLTSSAQAQANWTDLWRLLGTGQSTVPGGDLVYQLKDGKGTSVNVAASIQTTGGYASAIELTAFKFGGRLNAAEVGLLASDVNRLAQQCFNSSPDRSADIR
ncbi:hypothetical protein [Deinococcus sp. Marseille-Q6407]|uniref:hypothetical protein n=1 Tax=Deinococcus sp. Marseille-Q6407 TaxID=2969223 RepID=UPI0021BE37A4|nr:hypothetical protein [Deinococcus sp. Marseille-Q6407]